jgi:hypothetical protein
MGIRDIPDRYDDFLQFTEAYEREHFRFAQSNKNVGCATREMMAKWYPWPLRWLVRQTLYAIMEDPQLDAFGFPRPSPLFRQIVLGAMWCRARILRACPRRRRQVLRTAMQHRTYPHGYNIPTLGPTDDSAKAPRAL